MKDDLYPNVFVGTLYSGEAEFDACKSAIQQQEGVKITHCIISDLPELEAHNKLWKLWNKKRKNFDLFVKIDAETVLMRSTALLEIVELCSKIEGPCSVHIPLHDYYTDKEILGLNAFTCDIEFSLSTNALFADRTQMTPCKRLLGEKVAYLGPIGYHAQFPNERQAFFYGYHRMLKGQYTIISNVARAWRRHGGNPRCQALLGAIAALYVQLKYPAYSEPILQELQKVFTIDKKKIYILKKIYPLFFILNNDSRVKRSISQFVCNFIIPLFFKYKK